MRNAPSVKELERIPPPYAYYEIPIGEIVIYQRFHLGPATWYVAGYDRESGDLKGSLDHTEAPFECQWAVFNLADLRKLKRDGDEVERDVYW